jgi:hypothetical protein
VKRSPVGNFAFLQDEKLGVKILDEKEFLGII